MTADRNMDKRVDTLTDDEMDKVTGGLVNVGGRDTTIGYIGSIPQSGGLSLDPVNTRKDIEELNARNTPSNPYPQNCG